LATIKNIIQTIFQSQGSDRSIRELNNLGRAQTRLGQSSASAGRAFSAQASGLGGLVAAYAGAAATTFALQQAFSKLADAARAAQTLDGLTSLAATSGANASKILQSVQEATKGQLTIIQAAQQANLSLSAGFNTDQIERLAGVATKASRALGRDLTDAYTRVVRGSAKMETELLDELGIYTKIDPATRAYATAIGKAVSQLSEYERRQAFVNAVIAEGERKFSSINTVIPSSAEKIEAFGATVINIATKFGIILADFVAPLADFLANNLVASLSVVALTFSLVAAKGASLLTAALTNIVVKTTETAISSENVARKMLGLKDAVLAANTAIQGINVSTLRLTDVQKAELVALQQTASTRALSNAEMTKAIALVNINTAAIATETATLQASVATSTQKVAALRTEMIAKQAAYNMDRTNTAALQAARSARGAYGAAVRANNAIVASSTPIIAANTAALNANAAASAAAAAATTGLAAAAAGAVSTLIKGLGAAFAVISAVVLGFISFASIAIIVVGAIALLTLGISKLLGKDQELTAFIVTIGKNLKEAFSGISSEDNRNVFLGIAADTLEGLESVDARLKNIDKFTFKKKVLGLEVEITKTKEDLVNEVLEQIRDATNVNVLEALFTTNPVEAIAGDGTWAKAGRAIGAAIGLGIGAVAGTATMGIALVWTGALITAFAGIGGVVGNAFDTAFSNSAEDQAERIRTQLEDVDTTRITTRYAGELRDLTEEQRNLAFVVINGLAESYGGAERFNAEAALGLDTQARTAIEIIRQADATQTLATIMAATGLQVSGLGDIFTTTFNEATKLGEAIFSIRDSGPLTILITTEVNDQALAEAITELTNLESTIEGLNLRRNERMGVDLSLGPDSRLYETEQQKIDFLANLFDSVITQGKTADEVIQQLAESNTVAGNTISRQLEQGIISYETLRAVLVTLNQDTGEYALNVAGASNTLRDAALRAASNITTLNDSIQRGDIDLESFEQQAGAVAAALSEARRAQIDYSKAIAAAEAAGLKDDVEELTQAYAESQAQNSRVVASLERQLEALNNLKQGIIDTTAVLAFLKKTSEGALSALDFEVAIAGAAGNDNAALTKTIELVNAFAADSAFAKQELESLTATLSTIPDTTLDDTLKSIIAATTQAGLVELADNYENLIELNDRLFAYSGGDPFAPGALTEIPLLTQEAADAMKKYEAAMESVNVLGQQLAINATAETRALSKIVEELDRRIVAENEALALSQLKVDISEAELALARELNRLNDQTETLERELALTNAIFDTNMMLEQAKIQTNENIISSIEDQQQLSQVVAQRELAVIKQRQAEEAALLDISNNVLNTRLEYLRAATNLDLLSSSIITGGPENIAQYLESVYEKQRELTDTQVKLFSNQLASYQQDYRNRLELINKEKENATAEIDSQLRILNIRKDSALIERSVAEAELDNIQENNRAAIERLNLEQQRSSAEIAGQLGILSIERQLIDAKNVADKNSSDQAIALEAEKALANTRALTQQYDLLEAQEFVFGEFIKNYTTLLNEAARQQDPNAIPLTINQGAVRFDTIREDLEEQARIISDRYEELQRLARQAIDDQDTITRNSLTAQVEAIESRATLNERFFGRELQLERDAAAARVEIQRAEIAARQAAYDSLVSEISQLMIERSTAELEATRESEEAFNEYINNVIGLYGQLQNAVASLTSSIASQNASLSSLSSSIDASNASIEARRIELGFTRQINDIQGDIAVRQSEINLLKAEEAASAGSGISAQERLLTLKQQEINFQAELNNLQAESTKRRLEAGIEAAQSSLALFEDDTSVSGLAGSIAALSSVFAQQQELAQLQRSQAEEAYRRELELVEIDRALLEEEKKAKGGAAAASAAILEAERALLIDQQNLAALELDRDIRNQRAEVLNILKQRELQTNQAKLDGARAQAEAAANRQELNTIKSQADVFSAFINEIRTVFPEVFNAILESLGKAPIDIGLIPFADFNISESLGLDNITTLLDGVDSQITELYGNLDGVSGRVFENINANAAISFEAAQEELATLEERKRQLQIIQQNELAAFDATARAQAAGSAMELAEIDKREKELQLRIANATDQYAQDMQAASKAAADSVRNFVKAAVDTFGKVAVAQKQARVNTLLEEEAQLKDILGFQTEALTEAQSAASNALQEEISLREKLKDATESLTQSQTSYLESLGGDGNVSEASKRFIDTLLEQKQVIFDLQRATRSRISADSRSASLEQIQAQLTDALTLKTAQRIEAEASLEKTQERLAMITKLVSGEIGNFIKSLGSLGSSLSGLSGGGSFGQVFSNLLGFQDAIASFSNIGTTFAAAASRQVAAANTQASAAATFNNATSTLTGNAATSTTGAVASGSAAVTGVTAANTASGLTFSSIASTAFAGAGVGSLIGALTGDTSWASTVGGAIGSTLATVFAGSKFVGAVSAGIGKLASSAGFAAANAASIAVFATPLVFAAIGALIIGALFGKKKPKPQALISGSVTGEGFETTGISSRDLGSSTVQALESIPQQVFAGFLRNFEAAGLQFQDRADVTIDFYKGEFRKIQTTFSSGLSTTASNIGKTAQDAAEELERQFFRGLGADSFAVDAFTPSRENIQQALRTFGELEDLDQKTRDRFVRGLEFAQEFDGIVRSLLSTSVKVVDIFGTIDSAAKSLSENKLNEYNTLLATTTSNLGRNSNQYAIVSAAIRSNALSLLGLAETAEGSLVSISELTSELNAGAIAVRNIISETVALRTTLTGLGEVFSGINIDAAIGQALSTRLNEFVSDFGNSLTLAVEILREPARIVLVELEKFIVNGTERVRQAVGVYEQLLVEQANGISIFNEIITKSANNITTATELLGLELEGFISTISDKAQLQIIIDSAESIDEYAGAIARSAAQSRLAEINEIERTQATQQFNKVSREFTKRLREITGAASGLSIGGEGVSFIEVLETFGTTEIDQASRDFKSYLDLINSGTNVSSNFNSAIDFLNERFDNGETDSLKFVSALDLLQRVTLETVDSIGELVDAYESTLQQISEAFNSSRQTLIESISSLSDELVSLIKNVSDQTQEILGIFDDALTSVTETGNAIFDLRDAAEDAFKSAADAVAEFEKANNLSGKTAAQLRAELESVNASIAEVLGSATFDISSFIDLSTLTSSQSALQRELKRVSTTELEYSKLLENRSAASNDLAFVEATITDLSSKLNDTRSTESKLIQDTRTAVEEFTTAQANLADITDILTENNFNLNQVRIDENNAVVKLSAAIKQLNRDTITLDDIVSDILTSADSTLRSSFIEGAITNIASELSKLDETARAAKIAEVTTTAGLAFDSLVPLAQSIAQLTNPQTVTNMNSVADATNSTTDTFENLLNIFNSSTLNPVNNLVSEINRFSAIGAEIANVSAFSAELLSLGVQTGTTSADVAVLVSDLNALETQLQSLTGDSGVESLRETFKGLAQDLQTAWNENVILGLPDVINLSAISVSPDGGLNELKTIASNSSKYAYIKAVGASGMEQAIFRAEGGYVSGPGTSTSDSIPAYLSDGEYVIKASTVRKLGLNLLNDLNASGDLDESISYQGRFGDTIAAHINSAEMQLLKELGGSGTRNPVTGMLEFFGGASSGANAYGGLFAEEEAAYVKKIQDKFPSGNPKMQPSFKANFIDTRKLQDTYFNTVGTPIDLLGKGGSDIMDTASYDSMQNQMLSSTMILDSLAGKRGLEGVTSQTQGFGVDSYKAPRKRKWYQKLLSAVLAFAVGALTLGAGAPLALAALATAGTGLAINASTATKAGEMQSKDLKALFEGVTAQDLGRGGYDIKNSPVNKILANGNTIATGQSDLSTRYSTFLNSMLGGKASQANPTSIVDEYNKKNDKFFDFYMLNDPKIPNFVKPSYTAKNNSTGGLVNALNTSANLLGTNISGQRDSIPAMLEPGEFVLRKPAVDRMGLDTAIRLNSTGNVDSDVNVEVNVINNSSPVTPTIQQTRRENGKIVVDVILEDVRNNGPIRQAIRGIK